MSFEEAIKTAIEMEKKIQGVYAHAAREAGNPVGKKVFGLLATEESHHVKYLEKHLASWKENGKIDAERMDTAVPSKGAIETEVAKLGEKLKGEDFSKELALLEKAKEVELETSGFYKKAVAELEGADQEFFARFVEIEEGHLALVEAEINSLTGMGFWFDMPEFNLENA